MAGAQPTLTGVTDEASRGGLFTQSNIANPVSGADVQGNTINDSTVTLQVTIDGTTQMGTFTTNQAADSTVALTFTGIGGGSSPTTGGGDPVVRGDVIGTNLQLVLMSGDTVDIDISSLTTDTELQAAIAALNIPSTFFALTDTPNTIGGNGTLLGVVNGALAFVPMPTANVAESSFSSGGTIDIGPGTGGATVNLESRPHWQGNTNNGDNVGSAGINATEIVLAADTGLILDNTGGTVTIRMADPAPPAAQAPTASAPSANISIDAISKSADSIIYSARN